MIKLMSFPLRNNIDLKKIAEKRFDKDGRVVNIERVGIDKDMLWAIVQFEKANPEGLSFSEVKNSKPNTFGGNTFKGGD
mgnify:CR=1 FL=1